MMANSTPSSAVVDYPDEPSSPTVTTSLLVPGDSTEASFQAPHPSSLELPLGLPLSHQVFRDPAFDPDQFLFSRRHTALEDLRTELRSYLSGLKSELVGLINEDYEDFIGLGMGLRGTVERAMGKMRAPIGQAKQDILQARTELEIERQDLQDLLNERRKLTEAKKLVRLMLDCGDTITKVEEMLSISLPSIPNPSSSPLISITNNQIPTRLNRSSSKHGSRTELVLDLASEDTNDLEAGVNRIERITNEYSRMLYLVSKAKGLSYVSGLQPRIDQITEALYRESASLLKLILRTPRSDQRKRDCLLDCLRAYETLGAVNRAEEVIKTELVLPRMSKLIDHDALHAGALSPVLPASPELTRFHVHHSPHAIGNTSDALKLPEDDESVPLSMLYSKIVAFIAREMSPILEVADRHLAGSKQTLVEAQPQDGPSATSAEKIDHEKKSHQPASYNVLVNSVILPILHLIIDSLGPSLFAAGNPIAFHRNYSYTTKFLDQLEGFCSSPRQVLSLRSHPDWKSFKNKWQLAVYAQIRTKELILGIEDGLRDGTRPPISDTSSSNSSGSTYRSKLKPKSDRYLMKGTAVLDRVLYSIWQDDVFLADLTHRFWRLTLMAISRYATWLHFITASYSMSGHSGTVTGTINQNNSSRTSTADLNRLGSLPSSTTNRTNSSRPSTPSNSNLSEESKDEELLQFLTIVLADISTLRESILGLFSTLMAPRIPRVSIGSDSLLPQDILNTSLEKIVKFIPPLMAEIRATLVKRCSEKLRFIRSVGSSARASKTIPTEPSYFISDILNDIRVYLEKYGKHLDDHERLRTDLITSIVDELSGKYLAILINVQRSEDSLRKLKKGKHAFSIFNRNSNDHHSQQPPKDSPLHRDSTNGLEDDELKVKVQLRLDVERLEFDSIALGANLSNSKSFLELKQTVSK